LGAELGGELRDPGPDVRPKLLCEPIDALAPLGLNALHSLHKLRELLPGLGDGRSISESVKLGAELDCGGRKNRDSLLEGRERLERRERPTEIGYLAFGVAGGCGILRTPSVCVGEGMPASALDRLDLLHRRRAGRAGSTRPPASSSRGSSSMIAASSSTTRLGSGGGATGAPFPGDGR